MLLYVQSLQVLREASQIVSSILHCLVLVPIHLGLEGLIEFTAHTFNPVGSWNGGLDHR